MVFGSRFMDVRASGMTFVRRMLLITARVFNTLIVGIPSRITDPQCGMRAFSRAAASGVNFHQDRMAHCSEILRLVTRAHPSPSRAVSTAVTLRWTEVPIQVRYTPESMAKGQKSSDALRIVWDLFIGAFRR